MAGVIYVLVGTKRSGDEEIFYCGRADNPTTRERQHLIGIADPFNAKDAYEYARQAFNGNVRLEVIATEDTSNTEDFWVETLIKEGHPLQNAVRGNSVVPKKRETSAVSKAFRDVNARAKREERKASSAQQLTRPQVLAQRIRKDVPTAGELHQLVWIEQPPEVMGEKYMKGTKQVEYLKFGDFSIYLGWKGKWKCTVRCFNRHQGTELGFTTENCRHELDRLQTLMKLVEMWPDQTNWLPVKG